MAPPQVYESGEQASYDVFISHCKKAEGSEDRALWCVDVFEEAGMKPFFDLQNLEEISPEQLKKDVMASKAVVTVRRGGRRPLLPSCCCAAAGLLLLPRT